MRHIRSHLEAKIILGLRLRSSLEAINANVELQSCLSVEQVWKPIGIILDHPTKFYHSSIENRCFTLRL
jgi:hypothetical protein